MGDEGVGGGRRSGRGVAPRAATGGLGWRDGGDDAVNRKALLAGAGAGVAVVALAASAGTFPTPMPVDVTPPPALRVQQEVRELVVTWRDGRVAPIAPRCLMLRGQAAPGSPRLCVWGARDVRVRSGGQWRRVQAQMSRPFPTQVALRVDGAEVGLTPGAMRVHQVTRTGELRPELAAVPTRWRATRMVSCQRTGAAQVTSAARRGGLVGLSFDDGPGPYTDDVLRILARYNARATFYVVGASVGGRGDLVRAALAAGHHVGNHSWAHEKYVGAGSMAATNRAVTRASGFRPCTFRPPYGLTNGSVVQAANGLEMSSVLWSVDPRDWTNGSREIARIASRARAGDIVLLHDGGARASTVAALPRILSAWRARGLTPVSIEDLLGYTTTYRVVR